jgi:hypothetical protein
MTTPIRTKKGWDYSRAAIAIIMATVFNHVFDRLLGVHIELFTGIEYFSPLWILDLFVIPFISGVIVAVYYGFGGKWLCYLPPLIVRALAYFEIAQITGVPAGTHLIPLGWWGFFVILAVEAAAMGGILGEVMIKRTYGRRMAQEQAALAAQLEQEKAARGETP